MAVILIATDDAETVSILSPMLESLGHSPLSVQTTENMIEDVVLNEAAMVLVAEDVVPYSGWECCEILRGDPSIPRELPVLMLTEGRGNVRRLEKCGFSGTLDPQITGAELGEELTRHLGEHAAPDRYDPLADLNLG